MRATGAAPKGGRKRAHSRRATPVSAAPVETAAPGDPARELAGFAPIEVLPADAEKWLVHPFLWLQPELTAQAPSSSGLWIERRHKLPSPGFARLEPPAAALTPAPQAVIAFTLPEVPRHYPDSELEPLGWDPRTLARKGPQ